MNPINPSLRVDGQPQTKLRSFPFWEKDRGRLWYGKTLVKEFHQPAPLQRLVLEAFQESNWTAHIDDPLPGDENVDSKERLRNVTKGLNRCQLNQILKFWPDGTGEGICWVHVAHRSAPPRTWTSNQQ